MAYQLLWLARMPGLTGDMLLKENQNEDGKDIIPIDNQLSSTGEIDLENLKAKCEKELNLDPQWEEQMYKKTIEPLLPEWRKLKAKPYKSKTKIEGKKEPKMKKVAVNSEQESLW